MKKYYKSLLLIVSIALGLGSCKQVDTIIPNEVVPLITADVPLRWGKMSLIIAEKTPGNSPTYASRGFGYIGLTMYESIVNGYPEYKSMVGQLAGLSTLPASNTTQKYNWVLCLNAGQAYILKNIYEQTSDANKASIDSLEKVILAEVSKTETKEVIDRSVAYGQSVAQAIFDYSKTDGGYQGYLTRFPSDYVTPIALGNWVAPSFSQTASQIPLHPYWGKNRTFSAINGALAVPSPIPYNSSNTSLYYTQFLEVYSKNKILTQGEKEIAVWWADDPSRTFTPPGHSYSLAAIAVKTAGVSMIQAARTFASVGLGVADAFTCCWKCKYLYNVERPSTFVRKFIDANWQQFWPEPPFPAFYSGHSVQGAATATVLTAIYGENFKFIDNSHEGRAPDVLTLVPYKNRSFNSFWDAAAESAHSRFLGGIHTRHDNDTGLTQGKIIGQNIANLIWKK